MRRALIFFLMGLFCLSPVFAAPTNYSTVMVLIKGGPTGDFYMGKYEVTNKEYTQYDSSHKGSWSNSDYPVENVSWDDAVAYCKWLSNKTGKNYRLPTGAEWEYACRAGSTTEYYWGNTMDGSYCWYCENSNNQVHPVGQKKPNASGLYDMSGNVWEWCSDPPTGSFRVLRGGSWSLNAVNCQSSGRLKIFPSYHSYAIGFRLLRTK